MTSLLTAERHALVETIRDFARRECGTREQRRALEDVIQSLPMTIYAGATEVQLDFIAKTFGLAG
jgi:hypothetical protein